MKLLVTSIVRQSRPQEPSGWLHAVDLASMRQEKCYPIPESEFLPFNQNPRGGLRGGRGMDIENHRFFIANDSHIRIYDRSWKLVRTLTHPCCADIHDIRLHEGLLWVTSTCNGLVLAFNPEDGACEQIINYREFSELVKGLNLKLDKRELMSSEQLKSGFLDFRDPRNFNTSLFDKIHLNSICFRAGGDMLLLAGLCMPWQQAALWRLKNILQKLGLYRSVVALNQLLIRRLGFKKQSNSELAVAVPSGKSAVLRFTGGTFQSVSWRIPKAAAPNHSLCTLPDDSVLYADTNTGHLVRVNPENGKELQRIFVADGFLRGVEVISDTLIAAGCQNRLYLVDLDKEAVVNSIGLHDDTRVSAYDVQVVPDGFEAFPAQWPEG